MSHCVFIGIDYDEGVSGTYRAVEVSGPGKHVERFETGDPPADFLAAAIYAMEHAKKKGVPLMTLSSLTHFAQDDDGYRFNENDLLVRV